MLKVIHLQYAPLSAGRAALRLHNAFQEENIDSSILSLRYDVNDTEEIKHLRMTSNITAWIDGRLQSYLLRNNFKQFGQYSFPILGNDVSGYDQIKNADIIYLHWVHAGFLNISNIEQLAKLGKPIIFFMHDMWYITGGCHHSFTCEKYKTACNTCQMFPENTVIDWAAREFNKKLKLYSKFDNLYFVCPSKWLFDCAKQSFLTKDKTISYIPNIIDDKVFKPIDKKLARNILNIDEGDYIVAFGAASIDSPYKGWGYLQKALEILQKSQSKRKISVLVFGSGYNKKIADAISFKARFLGFLGDEFLMPIVYNAADVFIAPSLAESFGYVILESLCCGTPVVAFNVGGIPDLIVHKENGYLAKYKDADDLAKGIEFCIENNLKGSMLPQFEKGIIINTHLNLLNSIIPGN